MSQRQRDADFDMITDHFPTGYEPGTSLRQYFGSIGADEALFNAAGLADPTVDELLEVVIRAETREEMRTAVSVRSTACCGPPHPRAAMVQRQLLGRLLQPLPLPRELPPYWRSASSISGGSIPRPNRRCANRACSKQAWAPISSDGCC
jgi:hypothetical protein